jgi:osmotically-inducible protein OsmY
MYNDAVIANKVREAVLLAPGLNAQDIVISVHDRVVTLSGDVDTPEQVRVAESAAAGVEGVQRVENDLYVRPGRWPPIEPEVLPWYGRRGA